MSSAKPRYIIDGAAWLRIPEAARLLGSTPQTVKAWMGDGTLDWCQLRMNSKTLLVEEAGVLRLRAERGQPMKEVRRDAAGHLGTIAGREVGLVARGYALQHLLQPLQVRADRLGVALEVGVAHLRLAEQHQLHQRLRLSRRDHPQRNEDRRAAGQLHPV